MDERYVDEVMGKLYKAPKEDPYNVPAIIFNVGRIIALMGAGGILFNLLGAGLLLPAITLLAGILTGAVAVGILYKRRKR